MLVKIRIGVVNITAPVVYFYPIHLGCHPLSLHYSEIVSIIVALETESYTRNVLWRRWITTKNSLPKYTFTLTGVYNWILHQKCVTKTMNYEYNKKFSAQIHIQFGRCLLFIQWIGKLYPSTPLHFLTFKQIFIDIKKKSEKERKGLKQVIFNPWIFLATYWQKCKVGMDVVALVFVIAQQGKYGVALEKKKIQHWNNPLSQIIIWLYV